MGMTLTEKILARVAGKEVVKPGEELMVSPDYVLAYDFPGYTDRIEKQMKDEFGIKKVKHPEKFVLFIDHMTPTITAKEEAFHEQTRRFAKEQGITLYERKGIGHQMARELGYATPGAFLFHYDGHVSALGSLGALAIGNRRYLFEAYFSEKVMVQVPGSVKVTLTGIPKKGVTARDIYNYIQSKIGPDGCLNNVLEIDGSSISHLSIDARAIICGLAMFVGAVSAIVVPDAKVEEYLQDRALNEFSLIKPDSDAKYENEYVIDLTDLEPLVVLPPSPANIAPLSKVAGIKIDQGYIGSCVGGTIDDMRVAASILKGRKVSSNFKLNIIPSSNELMHQASEEGLLSIFLEAGAFIAAPSCDFCFGRSGTISAGQKALSTATLNVPGRMGSTDAEIFLVSSATVAASAIDGVITDPRKYMDTGDLINSKG
ncbi:3-isopropylmalate dehydratase large subunit [Neobacillus citreus]|uniref:aconitate hydratase n=1 Tax=Neobacillus citreus TaxID=2833578 RepID=A0A942T4J7_9BACI|nr:aconitase family protein [Neobacillus citreus]MCH6265307.1 aconitase family protein [Neobacillus citreus]